jgi:hypothetical protein
VCLAKVLLAHELANVGIKMRTRVTQGACICQKIGNLARKVGYIVWPVATNQIYRFCIFVCHSACCKV